MDRSARATFDPGGGAALIWQVNPQVLLTDRLTYFRFTRSRETRTLW